MMILGIEEHSCISREGEYIEKESPLINTRKNVLAKATKSLRKRVRFVTDSNGHIAPEVDMGRVEITKEERTLMFWDGSVRKRARRYAEAYRKEISREEGSPASSYSSRFQKAYEMCSSNARLQNTPLISKSPTRGLEHQVFPESRKARVRVVRTLVAAQKKLPKKVSPDNQAELLSAVSKKLTRGSRRLARLLGIGDAKVAVAEQP